MFHTATTISKTSKCGRGQPIILSLQFRRRRSVYKLQSSSQDGLFWGICFGSLASNLPRKSVVRCNEWQSANCFAPNWTYGVYCKKNTEKMQDCQCKELEALVARVAPRVVTSSNFSSKYALFKTTAYVCYVETKNGWKQQSTLILLIYIQHGK